MPDAKGIDQLLKLLSAPFPEQATEPSPAVLEWLEAIDTADPNSPSFNDEDEFEKNNGPQWGHYQFTAGSTGIKRTLTSRQDIGSCTMALQLLAAFLRTAKVARFICEQKAIPRPGSGYLADIYVQELIDHLLLLWSRPHTEIVSTSIVHECLANCLLQERNRAISRWGPCSAPRQRRTT